MISVQTYYNSTRNPMRRLQASDPLFSCDRRYLVSVTSRVREPRWPEVTTPQRPCQMGHASIRAWLLPVTSNSDHVGCRCQELFTPLRHSTCIVTIKCHDLYYDEEGGAWGMGAPRGVTGRRSKAGPQPSSSSLGFSASTWSPTI